MKYALILAGILLILAVKGFIDEKRNARKIRESVINSFGKMPSKEYTKARAESLVYYCAMSEESDCHVDDITWNDLDMDRIFYLLDSSKSAIGEEYLYYMLKNPVKDLDELKKRNEIIEELGTNKELRTELGIFLTRAGLVKNISVYEYIERLNNIEPDSILVHVLQALALTASIVSIFFNPAIGVIAMVLLFFINVVTYFKRKSQIECYFSIVAYLLNLAHLGKYLEPAVAADKKGKLKSKIDSLTADLARLKSITRGASTMIAPSGSGDILQSLFDYFRMALHIDLIMFDVMIKRFESEKAVFNNAFGCIGYLDCMLSAASFRAMTVKYCVPELTNGRRFFKAINIAHPLIEDPVTNSIETDSAVLLTGSNASGKSTFLKTLAVNTVLAQSFMTVLADSYEACCLKVMSSIALRDDIISGESYYIVETKSLKRILDGSKDSTPVMCFIDEVLRGTNTVERIAASSQILRSLAEGNIICFAATHDIELTYILEKEFTNYHFEEDVRDDEVVFDYKLHEGRAVSRNAIRLLKMMGYSDEIVSSAADMARKYTEDGTWT